MTFINPIKVLGLESYTIQDITFALIRKQKRKVFADIELSDDGFLHDSGNSYTYSEIEAVINQLDNLEILEYYHFISNYSDLQNFLQNQDESFILNFRNEAIFLLPSFISFVSPFYTNSFDKIIYKTYISGGNDFFKKATSIKPLLTPVDLTKSYKSLINYLRDAKKDLDTIVAGLRNKSTTYTSTTILTAISQFKRKLSATKVNFLPAIFQDERNSLAMSFRNLSVHIYNYFDDPVLSLEVIKYALTFNVNGLNKQELENDLTEISKLHQEREISKQFDVTIKKYAELIKEGDLLNDKVNNKTANGTNAISWVNTKISFSELLSLPDDLNEIKSQVALVIRRLSVSVWNKFEDIDTSLRLIDKAIVINTTDSAVRQNLNEAKAKLLELKNELRLQIQTVHPIARPVQHTRPATPSPPKATYKPTNSKSENSGCGIFVAIVIVITIIIAIANSQKTTSVNFPSTVDCVMITDTSARSNVTTSPPVVSTPPVSQYAGNSLKTGSSPYKSCFGIGDWSGNAWIRFTNDNSVDAIICLVDSITEGTIRNVYIRAGSIFKMKQITSGTYYVKVYSGKDWNPKLNNGCGSSGGFDTNPAFSSSTNVYNSLEITDNGVQFSTYKIDLSKIINSNPPIPYSETSFFQNAQTH